MSESTNKAEQREKGKFKLVGHSYQIADTGDYDGHWEITNGRISIFSKDDDNESLEKVVKVLNKCQCDFYLDDSDSFLAHHFEKEFKNAQDIIEQRISKTTCENCGGENTQPFEGTFDLCYSCGKKYEPIQRHQPEVLLELFKEIMSAFNLCRKAFVDWTKIPEAKKAVEVCQSKLKSLI